MCPFTTETSGEAILPTPAIGAVGLLPDVGVAIGNAFVAEHDVIILIGGHGTEMGQSTYLSELFGREEGAPPPVDLELEKKKRHLRTRSDPQWLDQCRS